MEIKMIKLILWRLYFINVCTLSKSIVKQSASKVPYNIINQSTEGAEFVWVLECQKYEGCEIIKQFVFI
jgi:hypothetical protein